MNLEERKIEIEDCSRATCDGGGQKFRLGSILEKKCLELSWGLK